MEKNFHEAETPLRSDTGNKPQNNERARALLNKRKCPEMTSSSPVSAISQQSQDDIEISDDNPSDGALSESLNEDEAGAATAATNSEMSLLMELDCDDSTIETLEARRAPTEVKLHVSDKATCSNRSSVQTTLSEFAVSNELPLASMEQIQSGISELQLKWTAFHLI